MSFLTDMLIILWHLLTVGDILFQRHGIIFFFYHHQNDKILQHTMPSNSLFFYFEAFLFPLSVK